MATDFPAYDTRVQDLPVHEIDSRVERLRHLMSAQGIDAYLISSYDPHLGEYVPDHWQRRRWISGFDGSFGHVLITQRFAHLFTDSRYTLQAKKQLPQKTFTFQDTFKWPAIIDKLDTGAILGLNLDCVPTIAMDTLRKQASSKHIMLKPQTKNLVDRLWIGRPSLTQHDIVGHPLKYAGESGRSKLERLRASLSDSHIDYMVLPGLDDIAWLFNIRGSDVPYNPVCFTYAIIGPSDGWIYLHERALDKRVLGALPDSIQIRPYKDFLSDLKFVVKKKSRISFDPKICNAEIGKLLKHQRHIQMTSPLPAMKSVKNTKEINGARQAHLKDGSALVSFLSRFDSGEFAGSTESELAVVLRDTRATQAAFKGESFAPIVGYQANGAIVHYRAVSGADNVIAADARESGLVLVDSGGQYLDGTTDITRTLLVGRAKPEWVETYTRVLKGHINLAEAVFPVGTRGAQLDILARQPLWQIGKNYGHGTGHGVGSYLCVHEGPIRISPKGGSSKEDNPPLKPGHILSNEPGYYETGEYGIRLENLILVKQHDTLEGYLCFETLTWCPFARDLIDVALLSVSELAWLNAYHKRVYSKLSDTVSKAEKRWLKSATQSL
mgnify:CR=1 FL=1